MTDTFLIKCLMVLLDTLPSPGCPGNMQQWQVNQRRHLFTSGKQKGELDGLLSMQTTGRGETFIHSVRGEARSLEKGQSLQELSSEHVSLFVSAVGLREYSNAS